MTTGCQVENRAKETKNKHQGEWIMSEQERTTRTRRTRSSRATIPANQEPSVEQGVAEQQGPADPGYIMVRVGRLPGVIQTVALNGGRKVRDAFEGANIESRQGDAVMVNTAPANMEDDLSEGDTVLLVRRIRCALSE